MPERPLFANARVSPLTRTIAHAQTSPWSPDAVGERVRAARMPDSAEEFEPDGGSDEK
jgi:hypothetical protein